MGDAPGPRRGRAKTAPGRLALDTPCAAWGEPATASDPAASEPAASSDAANQGARRSVLASIRGTLADFVEDVEAFFFESPEPVAQLPEVRGMAAERRESVVPTVAEVSSSVLLQRAPGLTVCAAVTSKRRRFGTFTH
jgi:hypothetical protein